VIDSAVSTIDSAAIPVEHGVPDDAVLFDLVGDAHVVLIGEASHGTHEFYAARARMTRRLIEEKGFTAVAVEADWPDAYRVNRYVQDRGDDTTAEQALSGFERFPSWMWRNDDVLDFVAGLREHNDASGDRGRAGFYGLDLYSLHRSIAEVVGYLDRVDTEAAARARERYSCLDHRDGGQGHGFAPAFGAGEHCEQQVVEQLAELQRHALDYIRRDGALARDEQFYAEQNARLVQAAEQYYRSMFGGRISSWNLRDQHMTETLRALREHLGESAKIVVWAHNSHLGDARATEVSGYGEFNVGQLVRERYGDGCRSIGFTTYTGTVTAADDWDGPVERKRVRPALEDSVEDLLHSVRRQEFLLRFDTAPEVAEVLRAERLERAIGVIYRPRTERQSHYFRARLAEQFDAVIHLDRTTALRPLDLTSGWEEGGELPESYPFAV
jgi:erythromycin esterase-like protein